ncbi:protein phosphatase inhibitor 2-like [Dendronephthya gigantea]|uniref:protein phosphatase inhibitor 2-like n=1 Tax=Dendronephthya gigantea TaxID=151771 RepID=UPI00106BF6F5|nr:protein phosphatase inhibitor 2-like [Dendronephthya gigantea]
MASPKESTGEKPKSILKHTASCDDQRVEVHWDEMNILQTYHPAGKDYGHMKINEPPTPYNYQNDESDPECACQLDPQQLAEKIKNVPAECNKSPEPEDQSSSDEEMSPEQQVVKKAFQDKRKHHYNEYENVKLARELIKKELEELEDDENEQGS